MSKLAAGKRISALLDIKRATLRNWIEREDIDSGERPGATSETAAQLAALRQENAELGRANEILKTASAFFRSGGARPPIQVIVDYLDDHVQRFGVVPICRVLSERGIPIAPSTYYAQRTRPVSDAELADEYAARRRNGVDPFWQQAQRQQEALAPLLQDGLVAARLLVVERGERRR